MTNLRLKHVDRFVDRTGKVRHYFRRPKGPRIPLPGLPGSPEFMAAYQAAYEGHTPSKSSKAGKAGPGTFQALVDDYFTNAGFLRLRASTSANRVYALHALLRDFRLGPNLVKGLTRQHVKAMFAKRAASSHGAANATLLTLRMLMRYAVEEGWRTDDPTAKLERFAVGTHHTWTDEEIAAYEARWPLGTRERTAFALLLYTGQRTSDVAAMSRGDIVEGRKIRAAQLKTGAKLVIPVHPELKATLERWTFFKAIVYAPTGEPLSARGLGALMAKAIDEAGLPSRCVPHGLRKAAARRLAEAGCTTKQIAAITGHRTLSEVQRYTEAAEQEGLAEAAIVKLSERTKR
jgi:site-specific recombinase XerD